MQLIQRTLDDGQAEDVVVIDLAGKTAIADHMIICTGRSSRHIATLAERLAVALKAAGRPRVPVEGADAGDWVLVDAGDAIIHIFRDEVRRAYNLEKMWGVEFPEAELPERAAGLIA